MIVINRRPLQAAWDAAPTAHYGSELFTSENYKDVFSIITFAYYVKSRSELLTGYGIVERIKGSNAD